MKNKFVKVLKPVLKGTLVGVGILTIEILLIGYTMYTGIVTDETVRYAVTGALILAVIFGCLVSMKKLQSGKLIVSVGCGIGVMLMLFLINMLLFANGFSGVPSATLMILGTSIAVSLLSFAPKKTNKIKNIKF